MGRPKKIKTEVPEEPKEIGVDTPILVESPVLESKIEPKAEVLETPTETPTYSVERTAEGGAILAKRLPTIIGGVCEFCGGGVYDHSSPQRLVDDWTVDPDTQIGRCQHYKGVRIRCGYCPLSANWKENIQRRRHTIFESPWNPKELIIVCDDMNCSYKHTKRAMGGRQ